MYVSFIKDIFALVSNQTTWD